MTILCLWSVNSYRFDRVWSEQNSDSIIFEELWRRRESLGAHFYDMDDRYGFRGEPVPDNAPEQVSQDTRWSWTKGRWIPRAQWHVIREKKAYERITQQRWQTMGNGRS